MIPRTAAPVARRLPRAFPVLFETWVVAELVKQSLNRGEDPRLFFWRDNVGTEVDVIAERGGRLAPIEIKSGMTVAADAFRNLGLFGKYAGDRSRAPQLVYGGEESYVRAGVQVTAWRDLGRNSSGWRASAAGSRRSTRPADG
jgi:predicted AAA+ superfamily ATPase